MYTGNIQRKPKQGNKRKKKPREEKANQQANHPKNSEKRGSPSPKLLRPLKKRPKKEVPQASI